MIQQQPTSWSCLSTSFAIVMRMPVESVHRLLGHDGSTIIHPDLQEPSKRRGFHIQEMIDLCETMGLGVVQFDTIPVSRIAGTLREFEPFTKEQNELRLNYIMGKYRGVLTGRNPSGRPHAVAWDITSIIDPALGRYVSSFGYGFDTFYAVIDLKI